MQVSVGRKGFINAGDFQINFVIKKQHFIQRVFIAEIFFCYFFSKHYTIRINQSPLWIAFQHVDGKNIHKVFIRKKHLFLVKQFFFVTQWCNAIVEQTGHLLYLRKFRRHVIPKSRGNGTKCQRHHTILVVKASCYPVNIVSIFIVFIIAQFIQNINSNEQATCESNS